MRAPVVAVVNVYVLTHHIEFEGEELQGVYATLADAQAAASGDTVRACGEWSEAGTPGLKVDGALGQWEAKASEEYFYRWIVREMSVEVDIATVTGPDGKQWKPSDLRQWAKSH